MHFSRLFPGKMKFLRFLVITVLAGLLWFFEQQVWPEIVICLLLSLTLYLSRATWLSAQNAKKIQMALLVFSIGIVLSYKGWDGPWRALLTPFIKKYLPDIPILTQGVSAFTLITSLAIVALVSFLVRDKTVMQIHKASMNKDFPQPDFKAKLLQYTKILANELNNIDIETNWSDYYFTPLEAEVEIISNNKKKRKVTDLLRAIKSDQQSQAFLVIGDPGSGKSTALRKLAKELLDEVEATGKLPVYINLREWQAKNRWTQDNPPTIDDLMQFVQNNLKSRGDTFSNEFLDEHFKPLFLGGRFFFLLDSFDEIPDILDANESSWILDQYSDILFKFLAGAHNSRGVLASRIFRKPTKKFKSKVTLEIRPFSEMKIELTFKKALGEINEHLITSFFKSRLDLIPIARNPFTSALIVRYLKENNQNFPSNQAVLYANYIDKRLFMCRDLMEERDLTTLEIIEYSIRIAFYLFSTKTAGLEVSTDELKKEVPITPISKVQDILDILTYSKIGRTGRNNKQFSFVHRRFNEYFVVQHLLHSASIDKYWEDIPTDSRWRDALVLYCEVAEEDKATAIARFCWSNIQFLAIDNLPIDYLRAIHSLRFLSDAFKSRLGYIRSFSEELGKIIKDKIKSNTNMLLTKFSVEATGLLSEKDMQSAILEAFKTKNTWIYEIALKSSRHLPKVREDLQRRIIRYINSMRILTLLQSQKELYFSVSLSDGFSKIRKHLFRRTWDYRLLIIGLLGSFLLRPIFIASLLVSYIFVLEIFELYIKGDFNVETTYRSFRIITLIRMFISFFALATLYYPKGLGLFAKNTALGLGGNSGTFHSYFDFLSGNHFVMYNWSFCNFAVLHIVVFLLVFPILDTLTNLPYIARLTFEDALYITAVIVVLSLLIFLLLVLCKFKVFLYFLIYGASTPGAIWILLSAYQNIYDLWRLKVIKRRIVFNALLKRSDISKLFKQLKTGNGRCRFAKLLRDYSIDVCGDWPNGVLPNNKNDSGSIMLAQLEERWLGLD